MALASLIRWIPLAPTTTSKQCHHTAFCAAHAERKSLVDRSPIGAGVQTSVSNQPAEFRDRQHLAGTLPKTHLGSYTVSSFESLNEPVFEGVLS